MKLAYVTTYDSRQLTGSDEWSGTGYYIAPTHSNRNQLSLTISGPLEDPLPQRVMRKLKRNYYQLGAKNYEKDPSPQTLKNYARQIEKRLINHQDQISLVPTVNPIAYLKNKYANRFLGRCNVCRALLIFILGITAIFIPEIVEHWHQMEKLGIEKTAS